MTDHVGKPFDIGYLVELLLRYRKESAAPATAAVQALPTEAAPATADADIRHAVENMGGDMDFYRLILQTYLDELKTIPSTLTKLFEDHDIAAAHRLLHTLKSTSASVGAMEMCRVAKDAELQVKTADTQFIPQHVVMDVTHAVELTLALFTPHLQMPMV